MKRRDFLRGAVASVGATALPLPAIGKVAATATAKVIPFHYGWACVFAQMNDGITSADIERVFNISPQDANGLMERMWTRGVLRPADLDGRCRATRAWEPWDKKQAAKAEAERAEAERDGARQTGSRARAKFRKFIAAQTQEAEALIA